MLSVWGSVGVFLLKKNFLRRKSFSNHNRNDMRENTNNLIGILDKEFGLHASLLYKEIVTQGKNVGVRVDVRLVEGRRAGQA